MANSESSASPRRRFTLRFSTWGSIFVALDFTLATIGGAGFGLLLTSASSVSDNAAGGLLAVSAGMFALMAVILGAAALLPGVLTDDYLALIDRTPHGVAGITRSFKIIAWVAGLSSIGALLAGFAWPALGAAPAWCHGVLGGIPIWLAIWAVVGSLQLIGESLFHFEKRAQLRRAIQAVRRRQRSAS